MTAPIVLYRGEILLQTPLHVGMGHLERLEGTNAIRRDGAGHPIIPGTALAGLFFEWMEANRQDHQKNETHWQGLSGKLRDQEQVLKASHQTDETERQADQPLQEGRSALRFAAATLIGSHQSIEIRDRIKRDPETRTVEESKKFAQEQVSTGQRFTFYLDVETLFLHGDKNALLAEIEQVLMDWTHGFWIGGSSGAGNGWAKLTQLASWHVDARTYEDYLGAEDPFAHPEHFAAMAGNVNERFQLIPMRLRIEPDTDEDVWGRDFLELQHQSFSAVDPSSDAPFYTTRVLTPEALSLSTNRGGLVYTIPGSSLRGALRAALVNFAKPGEIDRWFGRISDADGGHRGLIRLRDAYGPPKADQPWTLTGHAEDELTASTFGQALYSRQPLLEGTFEGCLAVPAEGAEDFLAVMQHHFAPAAERRAFSLGHGAGRPRWEFDWPEKEGEATL